MQSLLKKCLAFSIQLSYKLFQEIFFLRSLMSWSRDDPNRSSGRTSSAKKRSRSWLSMLFRYGFIWLIARNSNGNVVKYVGGLLWYQLRCFLSTKNFKKYILISCIMILKGRMSRIETAMTRWLVYVQMHLLMPLDYRVFTPILVLDYKFYRPTKQNTFFWMMFFPVCY